jgi:hypothetical protein
VSFQFPSSFSLCCVHADLNKRVACAPVLQYGLELYVVMLHS